MLISETPRLLLREMTPEDAEHAWLLNSDPEVLKYTGDGPFLSVEAARQFLLKYDHFRRYGFGRWAVIEKNSGEWLGWCGLKYTPELDEHDVGFRLMKKYWGRGYASEAARESLRLGFEKYGMKRIVGRAMKDNAASVRVLEKCGMTFCATKDEDGDHWVIYEQLAPQR